MATRIRLARAGRKKMPFYHVCVFDIKQRRDAAYVDKIGFYDPTNKKADEQFSIDVEKAAEWIKKGATPSETAKSLLKKAGIEFAKKAPSKTRAKKASAAKASKAKERKARTSNSKDRKAKKAE